MRSAEALPEFLADAISSGGNPGFNVGPDGVGRLECSGGAPTAIGRATEGVRLSMLLCCGRHLRYCTPHCVKDWNGLVCRFCTSDYELAAMKLTRPSSCERAFAAAMDARGLGAGLWAQVQLDWWHGCIDFVDRSTGICIQVDGEHHFLGRMYGTPRAEFVERDARNCMEALGNGRVLMRLHYRDVDSGVAVKRVARILRGEEAPPCASCVMLSPSFNLAGPTPPAKIPKQMRLLGAVLGMRRVCIYSDQAHWICMRV